MSGIPDPGRASKAVHILTGTGSAIERFEFQNQPVRVVVIAGEPWFVLNDLCSVLDIANPHNVVPRIDPQWLRQAEVLDGRGLKRNTNLVSEAGMYEVVFRSDKPEAVAFRRWVTGEVLPAIRRTGTYSTAPALEGPELFARAVIEAQAMLAAKDERIAELEPQAGGSRFGRVWMMSDDDIEYLVVKHRNVATVPDLAVESSPTTVSFIDGLSDRSRSRLRRRSA